MDVKVEVLMGVKVDEPKEYSVKVTLPYELFKRVERVRSRLFPIPSRSAILRMIIERGIEIVERELGVEGLESQKAEEPKKQVEKKVEAPKTQSTQRLETQKIDVPKEQRERSIEDVLGFPLRGVLKAALKAQERGEGCIRILDFRDELEREFNRELNTDVVMKIHNTLVERGYIITRGLSRVLSEKALQYLREVGELKNERE